MKVIVELSQEYVAEYVENLLDCAEYKMNVWVSDVYCPTAKDNRWPEMAEELSKGNKICFTTAFDVNGKRIHFLTKESLSHGIASALILYPGIATLGTDSCYLSVDGADAILQCALFGKAELGWLHDIIED